MLISPVILIPKVLIMSLFNGSCKSKTAKLQFVCSFAVYTLAFWILPAVSSYLIVFTNAEQNSSRCGFSGVEMATVQCYITILLAHDFVAADWRQTKCASLWLSQAA
jgi:hypothetical protein